MRFLIFSFLLTSTLAYSNPMSFETFPSRIRITGEVIDMEGERDIGTIGIGYDLFRLIHSLPNLYFGINSYSAMTGKRPGLITFGFSSGYTFPILKKQLILDAGLFLGGGGGANAPDGGGFLWRPHLELEWVLGTIAFRAGYSRLHFPTGEIESNQFNFGFTVNDYNFFQRKDGNYDFIDDSLIFSKKLKVGTLTAGYFNIPQDAVSNVFQYGKSRAGLIGVQMDNYFNSYLFTTFEASGALVGRIDGYMYILFGFGGNIPLGLNWLSIEARILGGPSGGGGVDAAGGALVQSEGGLVFDLPFDTYIKTLGGYTFAPGGKFTTNHLELSLGKTFNILELEKSHKKLGYFKSDNPDLNINKLSVSAFNRTYFPPDKPTKSQYHDHLETVNYLPYFHLIGFEAEKHFGNHFGLLGSTVWAYQGDYGAYAEGLLGIALHHFHKRWQFNAKGYLGAGGGGGIDMGSGLNFQYLVGFEKSIAERWNFFVNAGQVMPIEGNFKPITLDVGFRLKINQILKN